MFPLTVQEYDLAEQRAYATTPNRMIEAVQTLVFGKLGYPTRIASEREIVKFAEVMGESLYEERYEKLVGKLTPAEFDAWQRVWAHAVKFTEGSFKEIVLPRPTLAAAMNVYRHIRFLYGDARPRVLEVGPGSGHFAALLIQDNYPYAGTDITQAFYLTQNAYWNVITQGNVVETARTGDARGALTAMKAGAPVHIPWWEFITLLPGAVPSVDLVICNHALCEMHDWSLRYLLKYAREALVGQAHERKLFMFEGWGYSNEYDRERVMKLFLQNGFRMAHHDLHIAVFAPQGSRDAEYSCAFPIRTESQVPSVTHDGQIVFQRSVHETFGSVFFQDANNPVSKSILEARAAIAPQATIEKWQVDALATSLLGSSDHRTADEKFWSLIEIQGRVLPANQPT